MSAPGSRRNERMTLMTLTQPSRTLSVRIERAFGETYDFLAEPQNFPQWASGLGQSFAFADGVWTAQTPLGTVRIAFTPRNGFGVLDHRVTLPGGADVEVPMRVIANGEGSEVLFTLFRLPDMSPEKFAEDAAWVERDLATLKALLEGAKASQPG
ncbi:hypothetical protein SAMN05444161_1037 [Rhizobiales bacterium GAS191]|jgi:hypothetical protein|nr:hypothetical protein SAMN05519103_00067 [Rhizobiales bacterium GAS113]SEC38620.1 hypothetical protein SAMN05444161_1037 [Rhizobiales bacterium GAS191]